jgi:hypothetical protein
LEKFTILLKKRQKIFFIEYYRNVSKRRNTRINACTVLYTTNDTLLEL